jgi:hypothetical protein
MNCRKQSKNKIFTFSEQKSKLTLENIDEVISETVEVDGCEINDKSIRCDFLHIAKDIEFYIELKGQDLKHAIRQIEATILRLSVDSKKSLKKSYIICTRSPLSSSEIQNLQLEFKKKYNSSLIVKSTPFTDRY